MNDSPLSDPFPSELSNAKPAIRPRRVLFARSEQASPRSEIRGKLAFASSL